VSVINQKLQRLLDGYLDQLIDQEIYKAEKNKLVSQKKSLEEYLITLERTQTGWVETWNQKSSISNCRPPFVWCASLPYSIHSVE